MHHYPIANNSNPPGAQPGASPLRGVDPIRAKMIQEAAEKIVIDLNEKASAYLATREQSLGYLQSLTASNRELQDAKQVLVCHKAELNEYLPQVGDIGTLLQQLDGHTDSVEEHANCLAPVNPLQIRALDLMADVHASEDILSLLEEGLRSEHLTCDEYVKCVSDVGRELFVTRFLCQRVFEQLTDESGVDVSAPSVESTRAPPPVPKRLPASAALHAEFPNASIDIINDVLKNVAGDIVKARSQLQIFFA